MGGFLLETLEECCDLSQLWYREFYLEMTMGQRIQVGRYNKVYRTAIQNPKMSNITTFYPLSNGE